ncbi:MAG: glycoside hydrolase family 3 C-terminal domain-containing protein, partial [Verrucomicrobia bacterium]|nr:glycoside hydrolase family 3 C-terminal domain-containing protein [Verrucomicrobiota bacterium]
LLTTVLKGELGFDGFLISDWAGVNQIDPNYSNAVVKSVNAGMDMVMVPDQYKNFLKYLKGAVLAGRVSTNRIDDAVRRILTVKFEAGLFEHPYAQRQLLADVGSPAHRAVARQAVAESLVVLKDDNHLLPLATNLTRIHVAGKNADNLGYQCGGWTISWQGGSGPITIGTTIRQGITAAVSPGTTVTYSLNGTGAAGADVGIVVVGETPYAEGAGDNANLFLSASDLSAINNVRAAGIPVIVILVSGRPMFVESELPNWDAFIAAWLPGTEGQGVADVLFGQTFPVGILSHSWPRNNQIPVNLGDPGYNPLFPCGYSIYVNGDIDSDGLPDRWEAMHGLDPYDDGSINPDFGAAGNPDGDAGDNLYEFSTGTHPQLAGSIFRIVNVQPQSVTNPPSVRIVAHTVPGYQYGIDYAEGPMAGSLTWIPFANQANGVGSWIETSGAETNHTFIDDFTPATSGGAPAGDSRYYRVRSYAP